MKILLIEDEPKVAAFIKKGLEEHGYTITLAADGLQGKITALAEDFDLVILDINIPKLNGIEVCKAIRNKDKHIPVLMLTALGTLEDKVKGLDSGADDYLVKPFEFMELLARLRALSRRFESADQGPVVYSIADLELNTAAKTVKRGGKEITLTAKEFDLLEYFLVNQGTVLSRTDIAEHVWDIHFDTGTNIIDVYINYLRKKIDKDFNVKLIHTLVGKGYVIKPEENENQK